MDPSRLPRHVAVIMDGNGRWAKARGLPRVKGHQKGVEAVRTIVRASRELGIGWLTLYAFSEENWTRPQAEVETLMDLLRRFVRSELEEMLENGIRLQAIGRLHKLPGPTLQALKEAMAETARNGDMVLTLALSYGGRQEILDAVRKIAARVSAGDLRAEEISQEHMAAALYAPSMPDPDLLIRTSGELRLSNFLLWQTAYTELYITPTLWPDFGRTEYLEALRDYGKRERRFGSLGEGFHAGS